MKVKVVKWDAFLGWIKRKEKCWYWGRGNLYQWPILELPVQVDLLLTIGLVAASVTLFRWDGICPMFEEKRKKCLVWRHHKTALSQPCLGSGGCCGVCTFLLCHQSHQHILCKVQVLLCYIIFLYICAKSSQHLLCKVKVVQPASHVSFVSCWW